MSSMASSAAAHHSATASQWARHRIKAQRECGGHAEVHVTHLPKSGATRKLAGRGNSYELGAIFDESMCIEWLSSPGAQISFSSHAVHKRGSDRSRVIFVATATELSSTYTLPASTEALLVSHVVHASFARRICGHRSSAKRKDCIHR